MSAIGNAIEEEEEYRKARAEVNRKGADLGGYSVEGLSVGGHETCVIVPELKSAFDIGRCPPKAVHQNFLFITHAHLDHIVSFLNFLSHVCLLCRQLCLVDARNCIAIKVFTKWNMYSKYVPFESSVKTQWFRCMQKLPY